jgi:mannose PTS system EIIA component
MPGLVIIAHAPLATALRSVLGHVSPDFAGSLLTLDVSPDAPLEEVETQARSLLAQVRDPEVLILTDVFGATPSNVAMRLVDGKHVKVVAGVNVPMLLRALTYIGEPLDKLVVRVMAGATQGVMLVTTSRPQNQSFNPGSNDQDIDHHQQ